MFDKLFENFPSELSPQKITLSKGNRLFKQGERVTHIYFIEKGNIKLIRNTRDGTPVILHIGHNKESIAEASLFSQNYHCTAVVNTASEVSLVKKKNLLIF